MYCILVTGIPASGKSTLARALGEELRLPVISKDSLKEILFDQVGFRSREEKVRLGNASMEIMYAIAGQFMGAGQPFLLENNFERASEDGIKALLCRLIQEEPKKKPYSDQKLLELLKAKGISVSRRAVAQYRDELGIKSSYERRFL